MLLEYEQVPLLSFVNPELQLVQVFISEHVLQPDWQGVQTPLTEVYPVGQAARQYPKYREVELLHCVHEVAEVQTSQLVPHE